MGLVAIFQLNLYYINLLKIVQLILLPVIHPILNEKNAEWYFGTKLIQIVLQFNDDHNNFNDGHLTKWTLCI